MRAPWKVLPTPDARLMYIPRTCEHLDPSWIRNALLGFDHNPRPQAPQKDRRFPTWHDSLLPTPTAYDSTGLVEVRLLRNPLALEGVIQHRAIFLGPGHLAAHFAGG